MGSVSCAVLVLGGFGMDLGFFLDAALGGTGSEAREKLALERRFRGMVPASSFL